MKKISKSNKKDVEVGKEITSDIFYLIDKDMIDGYRSVDICRKINEGDYGFKSIEMKEAIKLFMSFMQWKKETHSKEIDVTLFTFLMDKYNEIYKRSLETYQYSAAKSALDSIAKMNKLFDEEKLKLDGNLVIKVEME
jgi:hypothetical protein